MYLQVEVKPSPHLGRCGISFSPDAFTQICKLTGVSYRVCGLVGNAYMSDFFLFVFCSVGEDMVVLPSNRMANEDLDVDLKRWRQLSLPGLLLRVWEIFDCLLIWK